MNIVKSLVSTIIILLVFQCLNLDAQKSSDTQGPSYKYWFTSGIIY